MLRDLMANEAYTQNGALSNKTTGSNLLNFFALAGSSRNKSNEELIVMFEKAYAEDSSAAVTLMFYFRDITQGPGERRLFRVLANHLAKTKPELAKRLLHLVPEYGRWDDVYSFVGTPVETEAFRLITKQWKEDINSEYPSLMAKWLKGSNPKSNEGKFWMKKTYAALGLTHKQYRKGLSKMRARLNIVESLMSDQKWLDINYSHVPSRAMKLYFKSFLKRDEERFGSYLTELSKPEEERDKQVKVNAKTLFPHEIVHAVRDNGYYSNTNHALMHDAQWKALPKYPLGETLSIVDVSGSMQSRIDEKSLVTAMDVAIALGVSTAQQSKGQFKNSFLTFSGEPELLELVGKDITTIVRTMSKANWGMNTDLQKAFGLILDVAVRNELPQEEIPERLLVISDMQFDDATKPYQRYLYGGYQAQPTPTKKTNFEAIKESFSKAGYKMPQIVFWNVCAQVGLNEYPVRQTDNALLLSGYNPIVLKYMYQNELVQPLDLVYEVVNSERYKEVLELVK